MNELQNAYNEIDYLRRRLDAALNENADLRRKLSDAEAERQRAVEAEREACAKVAASEQAHDKWAAKFIECCDMAADIATAIRSRTEVP